MISSEESFYDKLWFDLEILSELISEEEVKRCQEDRKLRAKVYLRLAEDCLFPLPTRDKKEQQSYCIFLLKPFTKDVALSYAKAKNKLPCMMHEALLRASVADDKLASVADDKLASETFAKFAKNKETVQRLRMDLKLIYKRPKIMDTQNRPMTVAVEPSTSSYSHDNNLEQPESSHFQSNETVRVKNKTISCSSSENEDDGQHSNAQLNYPSDKIYKSSVEDITDRAEIKPEPMKSTMYTDPVNQITKTTNLDHGPVKVETTDSQFEAMNEGLPDNFSASVPPERLESPKYANYINSEQKPGTGRQIFLRNGSIEEEIVKIQPSEMFMLWSENFSLDLALFVARSGFNCVLCVKNVSPSSMLDVFTLIKTYHTSAVEIATESHHLFAFGECVLPEKVRSTVSYKTFTCLESIMKESVSLQGKTLVNIMRFSKEVGGWHETLRSDLKEDCIITNTL